MFFLPHPAMAGEYYELRAGSREHNAFFSKLFAPCPMLYAFKPNIPSFHYSNIPIELSYKPFYKKCQEVL